MPSPEPHDAPAYRVLARKYRPETFADLIGQEAMVRTLKNAFAAGRIAHAFILTGVRGVGKTTTARIIAKGLNCIGPDGKGGVTVEPCGVCGPCKAIYEGRHVDVMELDSATHTQVDTMREILAGVAYRPTEVRYKVYIFDEVHMLSASAFNALLKTLEEPPEHVKFIFATTEIRKVPVTILSRCQRFDLRRMEADDLIRHIGDIATREGASIGADALALIARAAEGSMRDALSLLDQAIAHGISAGGGEIGATEIRAMLGLADRARVLDLFETIMKGDVAGALAELAGQYADGADPAAILRDLAEVTHWVSVVHVSAEAAEDPTVTPEERARGLDLARLPIRVLTRTWQMLLKALEEVAVAPNAMMAAEMAVIRLTHVADLPTPGEIVRQLQGEVTPQPAPPQSTASQSTAPQPGPPQSTASQSVTPPPAASQPASDRGAGGRGAGAHAAGDLRAAAARPAPRPAPVASSAALPREAAQTAPSHQQATPVPAPEPGPVPAPAQPAVPDLATFEDVVALIRARRDMGLLIEIEAGLRLVRYRPGLIEFAPADGAAPDLAQRLAQWLRLWTGQRWVVSVVAAGGAATIAEDRARRDADLRARAMAHPMLQALRAAFPEVGEGDVTVTAPEPLVAPQPGELAPTADETGEDWDPFDPFEED